MEGQVLLEKLLCPFPWAAWHPFSVGAVLAVRGAGELLERPAAPAGVTVGELLPRDGAWELLCLLTSAGALR